VCGIAAATYDCKDLEAAAVPLRPRAHFEDEGDRSSSARADDDGDEEEGDVDAGGGSASLGDETRRPGLRRRGGGERRDVEDHGRVWGSDAQQPTREHEGVRQ
jgi:hypothetical protein